MLTGMLSALIMPPAEFSDEAAAAVKPRVVSGMRPTGKLHLGHLVGALNNWAALQDDVRLLLLRRRLARADERLRRHRQRSSRTRYDMVADWIAGGLDPERSTLFVQSLVPEHAELYLLLSMTVPVPWLERVPTYKEQMEQLAEKDLSTLGFLGYPLLQTADIIIYNAHFVPVGEDQVPHLELSREIVRRFHNFYGELFVEPQPLLTHVSAAAGPRQPEDEQELRQHDRPVGRCGDGAEESDADVHGSRSAIRADIPGTVEGNPVFMYHDAFNPDTAEVEDLKTRYRAGKVGDVEVKTKLAKALNALLDPMRARRAEVLAQPRRLREILHRGIAQGARRSRRKRWSACGRAVKLKYYAMNMEQPEFESILEAYPVRLAELRGPARSAAAPHQEARGQHLRHPDRARSRSSTSSTST